MENTRADNLRKDIADLIENFNIYLNKFTSRPPFQKPGQFDFHKKTISIRMQEESASAAIKNDQFLWSLYQTIQAWGIGKRGSNLFPFSKFTEALLSRINEIEMLDGLKIDDPLLDLQRFPRDLWYLMDSLEIIDNNTKLVACSKTLHHILPDLIVPIDREYTRKFFGWYGPEFQYGQRKFLFLALENFASIAKAVNPEQFVGKGWNTSRSKIIDNAIVGFMMVHPRENL